MTTAQSPLRVLKAAADRIAQIIKAIERGDDVGARDPGGKIQAARGQPSVTVGVVMDDKVLKIEITWQKIRDTSEVALAAWILDYMREARGTMQ